MILMFVSMIYVDEGIINWLGVSNYRLIDIVFWGVGN